MAPLRPTIDLLGKALARLREAVEQPAATLKDRESRVVRFGFTYELTWKTLQKALAAEGIVANSPRAAFRAAFKQGWIEDEQGWLDMIEDRNLLAHTYDEDRALEISERVPRYFHLLESAYSRVTKLRD